MMHNDLINPATTPTNTTAIAKLARRLLVAASVVMAIGLTGVVFARGGEKKTAVVVWVLRGQPIVLTSSTTSSSPVVLDEAEATQASHSIDHTPAAVELVHDVKPASAVSTLKIPTPAPKPVVMMMEVTAYCPCTKCCGPEAQGITASGKHVSYNGGRFVAADTKKLKFGTKLVIPGYGDGEPVEVIDRGGAIKGDKLDVFFPTHQEALEWGRQKIAVLVEG